MMIGHLDIAIEYIFYSLLKTKSICKCMEIPNYNFI